MHYFKQRVTALGMTPEDAIREHGLGVDREGNILQYIRRPDGRVVDYIPPESKQKADTIGRRKTASDIGVDNLREPLYLKRYTPENLDRIRQSKPDTGKYKFPSRKRTGYSVLPIFTKAAIDAYNSEKEGGVVYGIEGYFKALSLALNGFESLAFSGNTTYRIDAFLSEYLLKRKPETFVFCYDGDLFNLSKKQDKEAVKTSRVFGFYNSARRFATDFFNFCKRHGLKTRLFIQIVRPGLPEKGVDDVFEAYPEEKDTIRMELESFKDGRFFITRELHKTTFDKKLKDFFGVENHVQFYNRYREDIGERPFHFAGATYIPRKPSGHYNLFNTTDGHFFEMETDPFRVDLDVEEVTVERYMAEATKALDAALNSHSRLCIGSPPGTGKTAFHVGYKHAGKWRSGFFERYRKKGVVTVPTVNLARQLGEKKGVVALHGVTTFQQREDALNAQIVVCTYDNIQHITDIASRILVVDECHNLVNQYGEVKNRKPFRATTLRRVVEAMKDAEQTVMISGTPPYALAKTLGFHTMKVNRKQSNKVVLKHREAESSSIKSITATLMDELSKLDFSEGKIHFVYYNSTKQLEAVRRWLIDTGRLKEEEVEVITRDHVNSGENRIFEEIINSEKITSNVRLVLSSCIIAEGVNILNENIGTVFAVNTRCVDSFRQYVARFRKVDELDVVSIRPPESVLGKEFLPSSEDQVEHLSKVAELQKEMMKRAIRQHAEDYLPEELEFGIDREPDYHYTPGIYDWVYQEGREVKVDVLRILAAERERMMDGMNNAYFYSRLQQHAGICFHSTIESTVEGSIREEVKGAENAVKEERERALDAVKEELSQRPDVAVHAYYIHAQKSGNRHATAKIMARAGCLVREENEATAMAFREKYKNHFRDGHLSKIISAYCKLFAIGVPEDLIQKELSQFRQARFNDQWRAFCRYMELRLYESKHYRKFLSPLHKAELKTYTAIRQAIRAEIEKNGNTVKDESLMRIIRRLVTRRHYPIGGKVESQLFATTTKQKAERIIKELFSLEEIKYHGYKEYRVVSEYGVEERPPFFSTDIKPKAFLQIFYPKTD